MNFFHHIVHYRMSIYVLWKMQMQISGDVEWLQRPLLPWHANYSCSSNFWVEGSFWKRCSYKSWIILLHGDGLGQKRLKSVAQIHLWINRRSGWDTTARVPAEKHTQPDDKQEMARRNNHCQRVYCKKHGANSGSLKTHQTHTNIPTALFRLHDSSLKTLAQKLQTISRVAATTDLLFFACMLHNSPSSRAADLNVSVCLVPVIFSGNMFPLIARFPEIHFIWPNIFNF